MARKRPTTKAGRAKKLRKVFHEFKMGKLHSTSNKGPTVTDRRQAIAIALSEAGRGRTRRTR